MKAMRRLSAHRALSALVATAMATGVASLGFTVAAPAADAAGFSGTGVSACHLYFGSGLPGTPSGNESLTISNSTFPITGLTLSNYAPNVGDTVTVTLTSSGLVTGPVAVAAGGLTLTGKVRLSGSQSGTVTLLSSSPGGSGAYPASAVGVNAPMGAFTLTGTFVAAASGPITAAYRQLEAHDNTGSGADNWCDGSAAGSSVISSAALASNGASQQTTNFVLGSAGFKVTRVGVGAYGWDVPPTWDPQFSSAASTTIAATATVAGGSAPPVEIPAAPTGLTAAAGNARVSLAWDAVSGATGYEVFRGVSSVGTPSDPAFTDTGLTNGTLYSYTVRATNSAGPSPASAAATATPFLAPPSAPTGLTAVPGDAKVTLSWAATSGATGYQVFRDGVQKSTPTDPAFVDTGLTNGTAYAYTVKAVNATGPGDASAAVSATPKAPPKSSVDVTWQCQTLDQVKPWDTTLTASLTGTTLNVSFTPGPKSGPIAIADQGLQPVSTVTIGGPDVTLKAPPYGAVGVYALVPGATMSGTVAGTATSVQVKTIKFMDILSGSNVDTTCTSAAAVNVPVVSAVALPPTLPTSNGALTVDGAVSGGATVKLIGSGFKPDSSVTAGMYSTATTLGVTTVDAQGAATATVVIPSGTTGSHTLVLYGTKADGSPWALTKAVTITAATASPSADPTDDSTDGGTDDNGGTLPQTGSEQAGITLLWAVVALQIGLIVAVRAARGRRSAPSGRHRH